MPMHLSIFKILNHFTVFTKLGMNIPLEDTLKP